MKKLVLVALLLTAMALVCSAAQADEVKDWSGFGNLEARVLKTIYPVDLDFGGGIALQLTTFPKDFFVLGGRKLFADANYTTEDVAYFGASISLKPADVDDNFRLGWSIAANSSHENIIYLAKAFPFEW